MRRWWPPLAWAAFILTVSSVPATQLPTTGFSDKLEHAGAYFILAALTVRAPLTMPRVRDLMLMVLAIVAFGAVDEWHQRFIPGRFPDPLDFVADSVGAIAGVVATAYGRVAMHRRLARHSA